MLSNIWVKKLQLKCGETVAINYLGGEMTAKVLRNGIWVENGQLKCGEMGAIKCLGGEMTAEVLGQWFLLTLGLRHVS